MTAAETARSSSRTRAFRSVLATTRGSDTTAYSAGDVVGRKGARALTSISNADPAVATLNGHGFVDGDRLQLTTDGVLPAGLALLTDYYVTNKTDNTFEFALTPDGDPIVTTDAGSGTHTAYPKGSAILSFAGLTAGGPVTIKQSLLSFNLAAVPASMTTFRLHLFSSSPPSELADNDAWTLSAADLASYLGYVDLGTPADVGPALAIQNASIEMILATGRDTVYGYLVSAGGFTPEAGKVATIALVATEL